MTRRRPVRASITVDSTVSPEDAIDRLGTALDRLGRKLADERVLVVREPLRWTASVTLLLDDEPLERGTK